MVRERYRAFGRAGGRARARNLAPGRRTEIARRAATARWVRRRFGASRFADLALPGGDLSTHLRLIVSFADACAVARMARASREPRA